jgi:hypothetical protein
MFSSITEVLFSFSSESVCGCEREKERERGGGGGGALDINTSREIGNFNK